MKKLKIKKNEKNRNLLHIGVILTQNFETHLIFKLNIMNFGG